MCTSHIDIVSGRDTMHATTQASSSAHNPLRCARWTSTGLRIGGDGVVCLCLRVGALLHDVARVSAHRPYLFMSRCPAMSAETTRSPWD